MKKKRILVLTSTFPRWKNDSTPPFVYELEKRLADDFDIHVLAPHFSGAKKSENISGLKIHRFQYFWPARWQGLCYEGGILPNLKKNKLLYVQTACLIFFELLNAIRIVKKEKIDFLHAHWTIPSGLIALIIKKLLNVPYLVTSHGGDIYGANNQISRLVKKAVLENAKEITVVSQAIKSELLLKYNNQLKIKVIPMGVDGKLFNPNQYDRVIKEKYNPGGPILLFVGRLAGKKGISYLIKAMVQIVKAVPRAKLLIIGTGTLEAKLKQLTAKLDLNQQIVFTGPLANAVLPKYYATADIFIGPSIKAADGDTEGLPVTFLEASVSGCVPIGTDAGGIPEIIKNGVNGFIVKQKSASQLAEKTILLLNNDSLRQKLAQNSRKMNIIKYDWKIVCKRFSSIYSSLL